MEMTTVSAKVAQIDVESGDIGNYSALPVDDVKKSKVSQDIAWADINFAVGDKKILTGCYGSVPAGSVCAVMGPSGAGKSSLLNVLAGRSGRVIVKV